MSTDYSASKPLPKTPLSKTSQRGLGRHLDELTGNYVRWKIQSEPNSELDFRADEEDEVFDILESSLRTFLEDLTDPD